MMKSFSLKASVRHLSADTLTPVGLYLRLRDSFPRSLLLECTDYSSRQNAYSYICLDPVAGVEVTGHGIRTYMPGSAPAIGKLSSPEEAIASVGRLAPEIMTEGIPDEKIFPGLFGFTTYEAVNLFDNVNIRIPDNSSPLPLLRYEI